MQETKFIWMNGKLVPWKDAQIHILTHTLHYGSGAFEGMRFYKTEQGSAIFRLKEHVARLIKSFSIFGKKIPFSAREIEKAIVDTVKANFDVCEDGYIRPILYHGYGLMGLDISSPEMPVDLAVAVWPWPSYLGEGAVKVKISSIIRLHPKSVRADAKICGYYINSILAGAEAKKEGYNEALLLDYEENIAEGPGENIFAVVDGKLKTPLLKGQILPGITRSSIIEIAKDLGYEVEEADLISDDIKSASEVFLTGTAAEVTAVKQVDNVVIGNGEIGPITQKLKEAYLDAVHGKSSKYAKWLTYVK